MPSFLYFHLIDFRNWYCLRFRPQATNREEGKNWKGARNNGKSRCIAGKAKALGSASLSEISPQLLSSSVHPSDRHRLPLPGETQTKRDRRLWGSRGKS